MSRAAIAASSFKEYAFYKLGLPSMRNLNFAVTYNCNSRCLSCNIWKKKSKDELSLSEIKKIFFGIGRIANVSLTGGEPFLRTDLREIVKAIKADTINISTNGLMTDRIVNNVGLMLDDNPAKQLGVSVSVDAISDLNDKMRGIPGSFEKSLETIRRLKSIKNKRLFVGMSNTISKGNIDQVLEVYKLAKRLKVIFSTRIAQTSTVFYGNDPMSKIFLGKEDIPKVKEIFRFLLKEQPANLFYKYYLEGFLANPNKQPAICFSGTNSYFLDPFGNIYPCIMLDKKLGSLREKSLKELLYSKKAGEIRRFISEGKCSCWTDCEALNSIYSNPKELTKACINGIRGLS